MWRTVRRSSRKLLQAAGCLVSAVPAFMLSVKLDGTELSGGRVTGPVLSAALSAAILLVLALALSFLWLRVAAACALVAAVLCLPLYLWLTLPGLFQWIVPGNYTVPYGAGTFFWDGWSVAGVVSIAFLAWVCSGSFLSTSKSA